MLIDQGRREFIAKIVCDIGKTILAVGLASAFFEKFPKRVKIILWIICFALLILSIFVQPVTKGGR